MMKKSGARRLALKRILSLAVVGGLGTLRAGVALAAAGINKLYGTRIPGVQGKVISRQDGNYELWRRAMIWHHSKPKRYPEIIVQAQSENDVIAAVKYAADNNLKVSVRAGGHNSTGTSVRHGGLVLDLSALTGIQVNLTKQIVSVQPGVRSLDLTVALEREGLSQMPTYAVGTTFGSNGLVYQYAQNLYGCTQWGNCKCSVLDCYRQLGYNIAYVGDGLSDFCPASKSDLVFAHKQLESRCIDEGVLHLHFDDFRDVLVYMKRECWGETV